MLFDVWVQIRFVADLIQDVIDTYVIYLVLCCNPLDLLCTFFLMQSILVYGGR